MSLTGDELTLNDKSYSMQYNGEIFSLGKLLKREKYYSPFHGSYSLYNNIFEFENKQGNLAIDNIGMVHNKKMFYETTMPNQP
jgi:hypothetical protein